MSILHYAYRMEINYENPVGRCHFTIKCIPREDARQHLLAKTLSVFPEATYSSGKDSFGNRQIYGCETEPHRQFIFQTEGDVEILQTDYEETAAEETAGIFRVPHGKCIPGPRLSAWYHSLDFAKYKEAQKDNNRNHYEICMALMHRVHRDFSYVPGSTSVSTTAEEAWDLGCGVCQDYSHIYITLLRMAGIPARYVCGLITGEGASHAWTEALCDGIWVPFDPTHDRPVSEGYIKLGHGRDAADCAINRGLMWNGGAQSQIISASVELLRQDKDNRPEAHNTHLKGTTP